MLSRLIITFLCAAAIGSVSGAFLTFDPDQIAFEDLDTPINFSVKLNNKPTKDVTVYFNHPFLSMSTCVIVFRPDNWDIVRHITAVPAPLFVGSSNLPGPLAINSKLLAKAVTIGSLSAELSFTDTLQVTRRNPPSAICSISENLALTLDRIFFSPNKPGWYQMISTDDMEIQILRGECTGNSPCITAVLVRYGSTVMGMNISGPVKGIREYSMTQVTQSTNGLRYTPNPNDGEHLIAFPYGSEVNVRVVNIDGIVGLEVGISLDGGYTSPRGLCNIPRPRSPDNRLIGSDGKPYNPNNREEVTTFADSWGIKDEDVLTNPGARTLNLPIQNPGTVCTFPENPPPKPTTTAITTTTPPPYSASTSPSSTSTISPSPPTSSRYVPPPPPTSSGYVPPPPPTSSRYVPPPPPTPSGYVPPPPPTPSGYVPPPPPTSSRYVTLPSPTSSGYIPPPPPTPSGYIPPPPPPPPPYVIVEIKKCCQSIFNIPSCNAIVPTESYIQSCILDAKATGSYVSSDKVKQAYLDKCRTLTDDMIRGTTKEVIDQGTKSERNVDLGMSLASTVVLAKVHAQTLDVRAVLDSVMSVSAPSVLSTPSVDQSLEYFLGDLPKPSAVSPQIAEKNQPVSPDLYKDLQEPIFSSAISFGSLHMVSVSAVVITSYILLL
ncbi:hypothetical protein BASA83_004217 [Batrachochytrium salamandrivorans]|nr:hypothetical protein BASA83_004217 [Batrachochytrium salamandrivorans]